ncbi:neuronal tyrosine-phosphorylated phosphoinositide-3-kinase adapter 1-like isoform X4 [Sylvia atricapilla]|uniref:neuronal tyrosine-phosphorylated phosphoinositide-3-kinase adapter 1-like isoform X4 n=1 Tax=Sylvia atricapilla TaxID=48155 RepID=UPI003395ABE2
MRGSGRGGGALRTRGPGGSREQNSGGGGSPGRGGRGLKAPPPAMSAPPRSELAAAAAALLRLGEERPPAAAMNLLQRKGRPEWRPREEEPRKGVPKAREGGSLRRPLRVGFLTLPAPQERGPRPCAPGMAPRSLSCHAVGLPDSGVPLRPPGPRTGPPEGRGLEAPPAKRGGTPRGGCVRQTPPLKPSRSPQTRLSAGAPPPALAEQGEAEEPVYIEMVGDARGVPGGDPRRGGPGGAPPPPAEEPEAIYEEMSCPLPAGEGPGHAPFSGHAPFYGHTPHSAHAPFGGPVLHSGHAPYTGHAPFSGHAPHAGRAPFIGHAPFSGPAPIPPPFPNLLPPRPPPLAPPPEGPSRLPLPSRREGPPPARARSHSTPLPPQHPPGGAGRERGGAGLGPLPLPPSAEAPPPGKRPPAYESLRGGVAPGGPALTREEDPPLRRGIGASARRGKDSEKAPEPPREERGGAGAVPPPLRDPGAGRGAPGAARTPGALPDLPRLRETLGRGLNPPHRVKSISMTTFTEAEVLFLQAHGNEACRRVWLGTFDPRTLLLPDSRDPQKVKEFLQEKYEKKRWYLAPEQVKQPPQSTTAEPGPPQLLHGDTGTLAQPRPAAQRPPQPARKASTDLLADIGGDPFASPAPGPAFAAFPGLPFGAFSVAKASTNPFVVRRGRLAVRGGVPEPPFSAADPLSVPSRRSRPRRRRSASDTRPPTPSYDRSCPRGARPGRAPPAPPGPGFIFVPRDLS